MTEVPERPFYKRKRWIAAAVLWLVLMYVASLSPVGYLVGRGWLSGRAAEGYFAPLSLVLGKPHETSIGSSLRDYARWFVDLGQHHAAL